MKRILTSLLLVSALLLPLAGCSEDNYSGELPEKVSQFIEQYFPGSKVHNYTSSSKGCSVGLKDGTTMAFDSADRWTSISSYGKALPRVLLYDQLNPTLFNFLETFTYTSQVWGIERTDKDEKAVMPAGTATLSYATGLVTYTPASEL